MGSADAIVVDTNVLLTATAPARRLHERALSVLNDWPARGVRLLTCGQIFREYLAVATRRSSNHGLDLAIEDAIANIVAFRRRMDFMVEDQSVNQLLLQLLQEFQCTGRQIHDANLAALAIARGAGAIVTENTGDFQRFADRLELLDLAAPL